MIGGRRRGPLSWLPPRGLRQMCVNHVAVPSPGPRGAGQGLVQVGCDGVGDWPQHVVVAQGLAGIPRGSTRSAGDCPSPAARHRRRGRGSPSAAMKRGEELFRPAQAHRRQIGLPSARRRPFLSRARCALFDGRHRHVAWCRPDAKTAKQSQTRFPLNWTSKTRLINASIGPRAALREVSFGKVRSPGAPSISLVFKPPEIARRRIGSRGPRSSSVCSPSSQSVTPFPAPDQP